MELSIGAIHSTFTKKASCKGKKKRPAEAPTQREGEGITPKDK